MRLSGIEKLRKIKTKHKLASCGFCFTGETFFMFSDSMYSWIADLTIEELSDDIPVGSIYLDNDSIKKITEVFNEGSLEMTIVDSEVLFSQDGRKLKMSYKEMTTNIFKPNVGGEEFTYLGLLSQELLNQTRIKAPFGSNQDKSSDNITSLNDASSVKITPHYASVNKILTNWLFPPNKDVINLDSDTVSLFDEGTEIFYNQSHIKMEKDGIQVYMPEMDIVIPNHLKPIEVFQKQVHDAVAEFEVGDVINLSTLAAKLYNQLESIILEFTACDNGFMVRSSDLNSQIEDFIKADHDFGEGFSFFISCKLLANIKYFGIDRIKVQFGFLSKTNPNPVSACFYDGDRISEARTLYLIGLLSKRGR